MTYVHHRLIQLWQKCPLNTPPFILPEDRADIQSQTPGVYHSFDEYISSSTFGQRNDKSLHVGLLPIPYVGNLEKASVFILLLNPGLSLAIILRSIRLRNFGRSAWRNLRQENINDEFPFFFLDPRFAWHPGFEYWQSKLGNIVQALADKQVCQATLKPA